MHWLVETGSDRVVLRRYGPWRSIAEVAWELELQRRLSADGWRVPSPLNSPAVVGVHVWAVMSWVPGQRRRARSDASRIEGQRRRGGLLGELHLAMQDHLDLGPRPGWPRIDGWLDSRDRGLPIDEVLDDPSLITSDARELFKRYAEHARTWLADSGSSDLPLVIVHGDLNPTNVLHASDGSVSIIDFDLARPDLVGAEFVWAPRRHPWAMVDGFKEVVSLSADDRAALVPLSWIAVLDAVRRDARWPSLPLPDSFAGHQEFLASTPPVEAVIGRRGSTRLMRRETVTGEAITWGMAVAGRVMPWDASAPGTTLVEHYLSVHAVEGLEPGAYRWRPGRLERQRHGDLRDLAEHLCLDQPLGGDSAFTVFPLRRPRTRPRWARPPAAIGPRSSRPAWPPVASSWRPSPSASAPPASPSSTTRSPRRSPQTPPACSSRLLACPPTVRCQADPRASRPSSPASTPHGPPRGTPARSLTAANRSRLRQPTKFTGQLGVAFSLAVSRGLRAQRSVPSWARSRSTPRRWQKSPNRSPLRR
jgi:Ser/Thr protein kinase RdoA (MazF antagonist)